MESRALFLGLLIVAGLASQAQCDDSTSQPPGRQSWKALHDAYLKADQEHGHIAADIITTEKLLRDAEYKLDPLRAIEAQLASTCAPNDPKLGEARRAVLDRVYELKVGDNRVKHGKLIERELETREAAIQAGTIALKAMLSSIELMENAKLERQKQIDDTRTAALDLMQNLDRLENQGGPLIPVFAPLAPVPANPRGIADLIKLYEDDAKRYDNIAGVLSQRAVLKRTERDHLLKLQEDGVMLDRLPLRLKDLDKRLEEIETDRSRAMKRSEDLREEIARLDRRKTELEQRFSKGDMKDGGPK